MSVREEWGEGRRREEGKGEGVRGRGGMREDVEIDMDSCYERFSIFRTQR